MEATTPMKAIRLKCLDCSNGNVYEIAKCPVLKCPLYQYRSGHNPNIKKKELSEEQIEELRQRLASHG